MVWLNASLAFALAMIIFCTMVTAITEAIHQFFGMRQNGLERMLTQLFQKAVWPKVAPVLTSTVDGGASHEAPDSTPGQEPNPVTAPADTREHAVTKQKLLENFLQTLTSNPAVAEHDGWLSGLRTWFAPRQLDSLTLTQFAERFADSDLGKQIWSSGREYATGVVDDVARRFQRFEEGATAYFAQRAQMVSLLVAILLAIALNVDAIRLFSAFLTDQQLTARVLAEAQNITTTYQKASGSQPAAAPGAAQAAAQPTPQPTAAAPDPPPGGQPAPPTAGTSDASNAANYEALKEKITFLNNQVAVSTALGLPIGNAYYPWCLDEVPHPSCQEPLNWDRLRKASPSLHAGWRLLRWFASVLLAGILIGLGGPFWFDAFSNLSAFISLLGGPEKPTKTESSAPAVAQQPTAESPRPKTAGDIFAAVAASTAPKLAQGRMLLTPRGTPLQQKET